MSDSENGHVTWKALITTAIAATAIVVSLGGGLFAVHTAHVHQGAMTIERWEQIERLAAETRKAENRAIEARLSRLELKVDQVLDKINGN